MTHLELFSDKLDAYYVFKWDSCQGLFEVQLRTGLGSEDEHVGARQLTVALDQMALCIVRLYKR